MDKIKIEIRITDDKKVDRPKLIEGMEGALYQIKNQIKALKANDNISDKVEEQLREGWIISIANIEWGPASPHFKQR